MVDVGDDGDVAEFHGGLRPVRAPGQQSRQRRLRPGAEMADDLGGGRWLPIRAQSARPAAAGQAVEEAGGVEIAGPGGVDHRWTRAAATATMHFAVATTTEPRALRVSAASSQSSRGVAWIACIEIARSRRARDLGLVGEQDVDMAGDQSRNSARWRSTQNGSDSDRATLPPGRMRAPRRPCGTPPWRPAGPTDSPPDRSPRRGDQGGIDVLRRQADAGAEIGVHGPLRVGVTRIRQRAVGAPPSQRGGRENARRRRVMSWRNTFAELVVGRPCR